MDQRGALVGNVSRITGIALSVRDPERLATFYCGVLGMSRQTLGDDIAVGYGGQGGALILRRSKSQERYQHEKTDRYWKIAITLPDLDVAYAQLVQKGVSVTQPHQFREVAYMAHLADPEGYVVELIQHTFGGADRSLTGDLNLPLGGGAQVGLITLRTTDIERDLRVCQHDLGMSYLSRQAITDLGFDLYFVAFTDEHPPSDDVNAIQNREWLWQRPYTTLEFQHVLNGPPIAPASGEPAEVLIKVNQKQIWLR